MSEIKFAVITICFNAVETIERTILSVLSQSYPDIEYIIVDGASTDKTLEIINKYSSKISKIVSEKDNGIYDAMNKGVALATGDVVYFLNADDYFSDDNVLADMARAFQEDGSRKMIYGKVIVEGAPDHVVEFQRENFQIKSLTDFFHHTLCHQSIFARKSLFEEIGKFNCSYKIAADYDWLIRAFKFQPGSVFYLDRDIAHYYYLGRSHKYAIISQKEYAWIQFIYFPSFKTFWRFFRYFVVRGIKKAILNQKW